MSRRDPAGIAIRAAREGRPKRAAGERTHGSDTSQLATVALVAFATLAQSSPAQAQTYPSRPITIMVALAAGTGMDIVVRIYAEKLSQTLGRPIVIENRPGNAGLAAVDGALKGAGGRLHAAGGDQCGDGDPADHAQESALRSDQRLRAALALS